MSPLAHFGALLHGCFSGPLPQGRQKHIEVLGEGQTAMLFVLYLIIISNGAFQRTQTST